MLPCSSSSLQFVVISYVRPPNLEDTITEIRHVYLSEIFVFFGFLVPAIVVALLVRSWSSH